MQYGRNACGLSPNNYDETTKDHIHYHSNTLAGYRGKWASVKKHTKSKARRELDKPSETILFGLFVNLPSSILRDEATTGIMTDLQVANKITKHIINIRYSVVLYIYLHGI